MDFKFEDNELVVQLVGQIDTTNAEKVFAEVLEIRKEIPDGKLVLDCSNLTYVSSAGLRQFLYVKKLENELKLINVTDEVYNIFDMTGFTSILDVNRAFRELSVDGCELIGQGSNGKVYRIDDETIVKVYKNKNVLEDIKREKSLAQTALILGVDTAISYDVVKVGDSYGSVYEMIKSKSLTKLMKNDEANIDKYVQIFVDKLKEVHNTVVKEGVLPSQKEAALNWVTYFENYFDKSIYDKLYKLVNDVPENMHMVHGDYHTNNVHYSEKGVILIDMDTISTGDPIFEFGSMYNAFIGFGELDVSNVENFLGIKYETANYVFKKTIELYFKDKKNFDHESFLNKCKVIGYTRMLRRTLKREPENKDFIKHCETELLKCLSLVDDLSY